MSVLRAVRQGIEFCGKHPFATGLFALLSLFGLVLAIVGYRVDRKEAKSTTAQVQRVEDKIDLFRPPDNLDKPSFAGVWEEAAAFRLAWPHPRPLADVGWSDRVERGFFLTLQGTDVRILVTSRAEGDCNACGVDLSAFAFSKDGGTWYLTSEARDFTSLGRPQFNSIGESLDVFDIGTGRFGIRFHTNDWHQGNTYEHVSIFTFVADELIQIADGIIRIYFSGVERAEAERLGYWQDNKVDISFDRTSSHFGFYDIIATYSAYGIAASRTERFHFDGARYNLVALDDLRDCAVEVQDYIKGASCRATTPD